MSVCELKEKLKALEKEALDALALADSSEAVEQIRLSYLGAKGALTAILRGLSQLSKEQRPEIGQLANAVKELITLELNKTKETILYKELEKRLGHEKIDVTLPGTGHKLGHIHPLTQITDLVIHICYGMGFEVAEGPEIETEYYNFDALNTPADHPARDEQDTFYTNLGPTSLLRSQTSTVQIRVMEKRKPPLRIISPGRVYRNEEINARKYPLFHQVEGLLIDRHVTFGQLKGTLNEFIRRLFGKPLKTRFRPDFFPFTEPSAELDAQCPFCMGSGCRTCGQRGWLELLGCGMVDPFVLAGVGIDSDEWSGFAFGVGIERLAMLKFGINDIRYFFMSDLRFLEQF
ncbi:MAG: phenylalanine--tRNA ligase subunit alpha [Candidatus Melainabacteria bacterium]|nr:phenylalanine--tRNA ligase subunit alpha [Candidatus Melainabacteria bacterium]